MRFIRHSILTVFFFLVVSGQQEQKKYVKIAPGPEYSAGSLHRFFFGDHWRDLWETEIEVEVIDLNKFGGGLTPMEKGGGMQTKSLKFKGGDGRVWKFRSMAKDPTKVLPDELKESIVSDVIQDQTSWANPLAPLVVAPLLNAVNVLQSEPHLVYLPDDAALGEYQEEFGGLLGIMEVHPDEADAGFYDAEKVIGTFKLFERLEKKVGEKVNSNDFLKARLMDVFLGDWDRHTDQWRWAKYDDEWQPIPRDRDQAFAKFDGVFPSIAEYLVPQFSTFGDEYPQIEDITWSGRFLDRRFLTEIHKCDWDSVTIFIKKRLTDDVIIAAVKELPKEYFNLAGEELIGNLISRRDKLDEASEEYFYRINRFVDVYCSDENDYVTINRVNEFNTKVTVHKRTKKDNKGEKYFQRIFDNDITKEIRVYLNDGDDKVIVEGIVDKGPLVRVIGGTGKDEFTNQSLVRDEFWSGLPLSAEAVMTNFYDSDTNTVFDLASAAVVDTKYYQLPETPEEKYEPSQRDRGHEWRALPFGNITSDDGVIVGGGVALYEFDFRKTPYNFKLSLIARYASRPNSYGIDFKSIFHDMIDNSTIFFDVSKTNLRFTKFYGYGNETSFDSDLEKNDYYQLSQELFEVKPTIRFHLPGDTKIDLGLSYLYSETNTDHLELLDNFPEAKKGLGDWNALGFHFNIQVDSRDNQYFPYSGTFIRVETSYFPKLLDVDPHYGQIKFDFRSYYTIVSPTETTLALRIGGGRSFGSFPFFSSIFLGGEDNLRGYRRERFAGQAAIFGQSEIRSYLTDVRVLIKGDLGVSFFGELGRVFIDNDKSSVWHSSYGGGLWLSFLDREFIITSTIAISPETFSIYAGTSFGL